VVPRIPHRLRCRRAATDCTGSGVVTTGRRRRARK
jgi:hypothetical protein